MSTTEEADLKAGHAPAVKAGGMRITQHKQTPPVATETPEKMTPEETEEFGKSPPKPDQHNQQVLIAGAVAKGDREFTPEAVKHFHEKPLPAKVNRPVQPKHCINQPARGGNH